MSRSEPTAAGAAHPLERWTNRWRAALRALPARPFFLGLACGLGACAVAGRLGSERLLFRSFVRFFQPIQPQQYFYPTASQLIAQVRHTVPPGRTPVLIGGASYFRGTGQNARDLWSLELQRLLGDRYHVINFAIDQAYFTSFAAVVFAALAHEYPDLIYVANGSPLAGAPWDGGETYQYLFWDAYYKGLLPAAVSDAATTQQLARAQRRTPAGLELHAGRWLDHFTYACDLWTRIGYEHFFTVWTDAHARAPFQPRRAGADGDDSSLAEQQLRLRDDPDYRQRTLRHARQSARTGFRPAPDGTMQPDPAFWARMTDEWTQFFPADLRRRCFVVFLRGNPHFMSALSADEHRRTELQYELGRQSLERAGYTVVQLRADDFSAGDYLDGGHLMPSGGFKVARAVASRLEEWDEAREAAHPVRRPPAGPLELRFSLADARPAGGREPLLLLAGASEETTERLSIEYLPGNRLRFVHTRGAETRLSPAADLAPGQAHTLSLSTGGLYPAAAGAAALKISPDQLLRLKSWLLLRLDGRPFWEVPVPPRDAPRANLYVGKDPETAVQGIQFSGTVHAVERRPSPPRMLPRDQVAGARLRLTLAPAMAGRSFPLAATGGSGHGDMLFLRVAADGAVTFGYDHWATPALLSRETRFGFGTERRVEFQLPALASDGGRRPLVVWLDGTEVWRQDAPFFPAGAHGVHFGASLPGASTAEAHLEGGVFEAVLVPTWEG